MIDWRELFLSVAVGCLLSDANFLVVVVVVVVLAAATILLLFLF